MKIVLLQAIYWPNQRGGAEMVAENIVSGLLGRGEQVAVITVGQKDEIKKREEKIYYLKSRNLFNFFALGEKSLLARFFWHLFDLFNFGQAKAIEKILKQEKPDLVLTHNLKGLGYLTAGVIKKLKLKHFHTIHDMQLLHPSGLLPQRLSRPAKVYGWFCRKLFGSPEKVFFPSEYIKKIYEQAGFFPGSQRIVLANPIKLAPPVAKKENNSLDLLFLGQVEEYKGIFKLIDAVLKIKGDLVLRVVGDGQALGAAQKLAQGDPRIKFCGRLNQVELKTVWPQIDLLVNPSQTPESFGLVVIEAYGQGAPVLANNIGALPELVREGETGWLVKNNEWREKIEWCLAHREQLMGMRENCLKEAKRYDIEEYLNKLMAWAKI